MKKQILFIYGIVIILPFVVMNTACNNSTETASTADTAAVVKERSRLLTTFDKISIRRYSFPIRHRDSLLKIPLALDEYIKRRSAFTYQIANLQKDTILPPLLKLERLREAKVQQEELEDHAYLTALTVCGYHNKLIDVEMFLGDKGVSHDFVMSRSPSIGLLRWNNSFGNAFSNSPDTPGTVQGVPWGSGCLISDDLFLTAGHCFETCPNDYNSYRTPVKNDVLVQSGELAKYMNVLFNYEINSVTHMVRGDTMSFQVDSLMEFKQHGIDYAIIRLKPDRLGRKAGQLFKKMTPVPDGFVLKAQQVLCIIQQDNASVKKVGCGHVSVFNDQSVFYGDIDTDFGSSGAPVFDLLTGGLIGVHTDGDCTETAGSNYAARVDLIKKYSKYLK